MNQICGLLLCGTVLAITTVPAAAVGVKATYNGYGTITEFCGSPSTSCTAADSHFGLGGEAETTYQMSFIYDVSADNTYTMRSFNLTINGRALSRIADSGFTNRLWDEGPFYSGESSFAVVHNAQGASPTSEFSASASGAAFFPFNPSPRLPLRHDAPVIASFHPENRFAEFTLDDYVLDAFGERTLARQIQLATTFLDDGPDGVKIERLNSLTPIPLPAALPLLVSAAIAMGIAGRKRKTA